MHIFLLLVSSCSASLSLSLQPLVIARHSHQCCWGIGSHAIQLAASAAHPLFQMLMLMRALMVMTSSPSPHRKYMNIYIAIFNTHFIPTAGTWYVSLHHASRRVNPSCVPNVADIVGSARQPAQQKMRSSSSIGVQFFSISC